MGTTIETAAALRKAGDALREAIAALQQEHGVPVALRTSGGLLLICDATRLHRSHWQDDHTDHGAVLRVLPLLPEEAPDGH